MSWLDSIGDFFSGAANDVSNYFGGGSATPDATPAATSSDTTSVLPTGTGQDYSFLTNTPSSSYGSFNPSDLTGTNASANAGGTGNFNSAQNISQFSSPSAPSAIGAGVASDPNSVSLGSNAYSTTNPNPTTSSPSTVQQISSALGLGNISTGDVLKGAVGLGGLINTAVNSGSSVTGEKDLKNTANTEAQQGQQLESYLANGTLPPGAQAYVDQQVAAQKAAIQSKYAAMGMSGSTAEIQELNNVDTQATTQMFQLATQLYNTGVTQTDASGQLYQQLMQAQNNDNNQIGQAIQNFVGALGGGTTSQTKGTISFG